LERVVEAEARRLHFEHVRAEVPSAPALLVRQWWDELFPERREDWMVKAREVLAARWSDVDEGGEPDDVEALVAKLKGALPVVPERTDRG
jgi:hypothetical protein